MPVSNSIALRIVLPAVRGIKEWEKKGEGSSGPKRVPYNIRSLAHNFQQSILSQ